VVLKSFLLLCSVALSILAYGEDMAEKVRMQNLKVVRMAAESLSEELPQKIDPYTELKAVEADGTKLIYRFELSVGPKSDEQIVREGKTRMERNVKKGICKSSKRFLENDIDIVYIYTSAATGKTLFSFTVGKRDCHYR